MAMLMGIGLVGIGVMIGIALTSAIHQLSWEKVFKAGQQAVELSAAAKKSLDAAAAYEAEAKKFRADAEKYEAEAKKYKEDWALANHDSNEQIKRLNIMIQETQKIRDRSSGC